MTSPSPDTPNHVEIAVDRPRDWLTIVLAVVLVAVLAGFTIFAFVTIDKFQTLDQNQHQDACVASLTSDYFLAINNALVLGRTATPAQVTAVQSDLNTTAERIRNRGTICADGVPDTFIPQTPTPTPTTSKGT